MCSVKNTLLILIMYTSKIIYLNMNVILLNTSDTIAELNENYWFHNLSLLSNNELDFIKFCQECPIYVNSEILKWMFRDLPQRTNKFMSDIMQEFKSCREEAELMNWKQH